MFYIRMLYLHVLQKKFLKLKEYITKTTTVIEVDGEQTLTSSMLSDTRFQSLIDKPFLEGFM